MLAPRVRVHCMKAFNPSRNSKLFEYKILRHITGSSVADRSSALYCFVSKYAGMGRRCLRSPTLCICPHPSTGFFS